MGFWLAHAVLEYRRDVITHYCQSWGKDSSWPDPLSLSFTFLKLILLKKIFGRNLHFQPFFEVPGTPKTFEYLSDYWKITWIYCDSRAKKKKISEKLRMENCVHHVNSICFVICNMTSVSFIDHFRPLILDYPHFTSEFVESFMLEDEISKPNDMFLNMTRFSWEIHWCQATLAHFTCVYSWLWWWKGSEISFIIHIIYYI